MTAEFAATPKSSPTRGGLDELRRIHITSTLSNGHIALPVDLARHAAGLRTAFIARPLEYGPGSTPHPAPQADLSASDLPELAQLLRATRDD